MEIQNEDDLNYVKDIRNDGNTERPILRIATTAKNKEILVKMIKFTDLNSLNAKFNEVKALFLSFNQFESERLEIYKNIVKILGFFISSNKQSLCIALEYYPEGDLSDLINTLNLRGRKLSQYQIMRMLRQLVRILSKLQGQNIAHRDIKSENIFIENEGENLILGDLGEALKVTDESSEFSVVGTPGYMSPILYQKYKEINPSNNIRKVRHDVFKSDVYSLGIVLIELLTFEDVLSIKNNLKNNPNYLDLITQDYPLIRDFLGKMVCEDEVSRYSFRYLESRIDPIYEQVYFEACFNCNRQKDYGDFYNTGEEFICKLCIDSIDYSNKFHKLIYCEICSDRIYPDLLCLCKNLRCGVCGCFHGIDKSCLVKLESLPSGCMELFFICGCEAKVVQNIHLYEMYCFDCSISYCVVCLSNIREGRHEACQFYLRNCDRIFRYKKVKITENLEIKFK